MNKMGFLPSKRSIQEEPLAGIGLLGRGTHAERREGVKPLVTSIMALVITFCLTKTLIE